MTPSCDVAVVGSGFAGSLLARILATLGRVVVLLERGAHPRFAIGESTTPLANLSLERIARRYGLPDCHNLAAHGRWIEHLPHLRRGLKRGFTFYRHHPGQPLACPEQDAERLMVAASPSDHVADTHWLRADADHHFVREAVAAGVDYRDRVHLTRCEFSARGALLTGRRDDAEFRLDARFVIDASGPGGFLARQLGIPDGIDRTFTRSDLLFSHFANVPLVSDLVPGLSNASRPYPDDWAAVHHVIDEGWMYSLRFDDGVVSAGFLLRDAGRTGGSMNEPAEARWRTLLARYPTIAAAFGDATALMPIAYRPRIQHRLARATGERWALLPHAYAFVDPLFSTGIAWALRSVERLALAFEQSGVGEGAKSGARGVPSAGQLARYEQLLSAEADQIDRLVAGAYDAMVHFDLFTAHALIYFTAVSYAEASQRILPGDDVAWSGFLGVGDAAIERVPEESRARLRALTRAGTWAGSAADRAGYVRWATDAIAPRNICGFGDAGRRHLYPVDLEVLVDRHALLGVSRDQLVAALPALRGTSSASVAG